MAARARGSSPRSSSSSHRIFRICSSSTRSERNMSCLNQNPDRLYELVPVVYRLRDADQGYPLRALLRVIAEQVNLVEKDIADLYENWFIETCADWVVPYIGTLVNYQPVHDAGEPTAGRSPAT